MNPGSAYENIFQVLRDERLTHIQSIRALSYKEGFWVSSKDHPWVEVIYDEIAAHWNQLRADAFARSPPALIVNNLYPPFSTDIRKTGSVTYIGRKPVSQRQKSAFETRLRLYGNLCGIMPGSTTILTNQISHDEENDIFYLPHDLLVYLILLHPFLSNDICTLLPRRLRWYDEEDRGGPTFFNFGALTPIIEDGQRFFTASRSIAPASGFFLLDPEITSTDIRESLTKTPKDNADTDILTILPWIPHCDPIRYVEILKKHETEFKIYRHSMSRNFLPNSGDVDFWRNIQDTSIALKKIDLAYQAKRRELNWKEVEVGVGVSLALGAFFLPDSLGNLKTIAASVASTKTALDAFQWLSHSSKLQEIINQHDQWFLWKWDRTSDR